MSTNLPARALAIALLYFVAAGSYIVISGLWLANVESDPESYLGWEIAKGLGFVTVTSVLLYALLHRLFASVDREVARQRETERALRDSLDALARAQRVARVGSWQTDLSTDDIEWSEEVDRIFGFAPEPGGRSAEDFLARVHEDDRETLLEAQRRSRASGGPLNVELRIVRPDGEERHVQVRGEVRPDQHGGPGHQIGTVQDITDRKRAELELEKRNRQQAAIAELGIDALRDASLPQAMNHAMDAAGRALAIDLVAVLELQPDAAELLMIAGRGWPADYVGRRRVRAGADSQAGYTLSVNEPVLVTDWRTETRFRPPPGFVEQGVMCGISTVIHGQQAPWGVLGLHATRLRTFTRADVDFVQALANLIAAVVQREQAARALREHDILRRIAAEAAAMGGWALDRASDVVTWSEEVARIHEVEPGYRPDRPTALNFYAPEHRERIDQCLKACTQLGTPFDEELQIVTARGRRVWVRTIGRPDRDEAGNVVAVHGAIQDISERKALESMLHQSQRLEAVGQLTGGVAHDFNNLLTVILGNADLMAEAAVGNEYLQALALGTQQAARRGAELTSRLLAYARKQPLEPEPTNVATLLASMDHLLRRTLGEKIEIEVVHGGGLWTAMVDPAQLESAVLNLCLNARDAMPDGGRLTLETANVRLDENYSAAHHEVAPGHYVMIAVTDTGHGLEPELAERVFEPFFTTKPSGQGSGLGLSMVYGFVKQSNGHVKLYSEPGQGTTVKLYLPRSHDQARAVDRPVRGTTPRGAGERILVVEDDALVRRFVSEQLVELGYQVIVAANAGDALQIMEDDGAHVDLLFTDVVMPGGMDGRQLAEVVRQQRPDLPVLFTSGYTENAIVHQGRLDPGVSLLNKPYRLTDLAEKIHGVLHPDTD